MKLPPFGKPLKDLLNSGQLPNNSVYLYIGNEAWDKGKISSYYRPTRTLILPPDCSPLLYKWPVNGCDILMIETTFLDTGYIENFVNILFEYGATRVTLIDIELFLTIYKKDF